MSTIDRLKILKTKLDNKDKVINQLLERISNLEYEVERLHSIIKEVREYMKSIEHEPDADMYIELGQYKEYKHILEILDKENKE